MDKLNDIEKKLAKILALAERGVGGEKRNAKIILERMLKKHGLSLEELVRKMVDVHNTVRKTYKYSTRMERQILFQCYSKVTQKGRVEYYKYKGETKVIFELTELDHVELSEMYDYYKRLFKEEITFIVEAFIAKHELYRFREESDEPHDEPVDIDRIERIRKMMANMKDSEFVTTRKRLKGK